jgi:hypothetical protein
MHITLKILVVFVVASLALVVLAVVLDDSDELCRRSGLCGVSSYADKFNIKDVK